MTAIVVPRFTDHELLEIAQNRETGVVWVRLLRGNEELLVTADSYFVPPIARQVKRMFPPPSLAAQSVRLANELAGSLRLIDGGQK
jgi:hypothetical protein